MHDRKLSDTDGESGKRDKIRAEIVSTESTYSDALKLLADIYVQGLQVMSGNEKAYGATAVQFQKLQLNIVVLERLHDAMLAKMIATPSCLIATVLLEHADLMKSYIQYMNDYPECLQALTELKKNKKFSLLVEDINFKLADADPCFQT